jgi:hypothetical protein
MRSRRRIAFLKAWDRAKCVDDYSRDLRLTKWGSAAGLHSSNPKPLMSAMVIATIGLCPHHVHFTPESGHCRVLSQCPLCAKSGLMHRSKNLPIRCIGVNK